MRKMILIPEEQYYRMLETYDQIVEEVISLREQLEILKLTGVKSSEIQQVKVEIRMKSKGKTERISVKSLKFQCFFNT